MRIAATSALIFVVFLGLGFQAGQQGHSGPRAGSKAGPKAVPATVEQYDPEHLGPGEVACGRDKPGVPNPCHCVQHRIKASEAAQLQCELVKDKLERAKCMVSNEVCAIVPVDADSAGYDEHTGDRMPAQCRRSCSKARCECCRS